jgi:hypothetical protein
MKPPVQPHLVARAGLRLLSVLPSRLDPLLPPGLDPRPKVFGIGFHKTGTSSLGRALRTLGYRVQKGFTFNRPGKRVVIPQPVTLDKVRDVALPLVSRYSAFEDNPWPLLFRELDAAFPGSKFILTVRDPDRWVRSMANYFGTKSNATLDLIYGRRGVRVAGSEDLVRARFERHNADVAEHFSSRPADLLVWDLAAEPGWEAVCRFLGCRVPQRPFPHANASAERRAA